MWCFVKALELKYIYHKHEVNLRNILLFIYWFTFSLNAFHCSWVCYKPLSVNWSSTVQTNRYRGRRIRNFTFTRFIIYCYTLTNTSGLFTCRSPFLYSRFHYKINQKHIISKFHNFTYTHTHRGGIANSFLLLLNQIYAWWKRQY